MSAQLSPASFVAKWSGTALSERAASQEHFIDLCHLLGQPTPADHDATGAEYTFEKSVAVTDAASAGSKGDHGFADVWWKGKFAWEYKRKGKHKDLTAAYRQLCQYREALENPPLLIVSDIARTEIHTNFTGRAKQVHTILLEDLAEPASLDLLRRVFTDPLSFEPEVTAEHVTEAVAKEIGQLALQLRARGHDPHDTAHFLMKSMFCLFAEDIRLLPADLFQKLVGQWKSDPPELTKVLTELFSKMQTGGAFGVDKIAFFNGGLFDDAPALELTDDEANVLLTAARQDWGSVEPAIFGTLFERSLDPNTRAQIGAHYTSKDDILLVVEPVVMTPLRREWADVQAKVAEQLERRAAAKTKPTRTKADRAIADLLDGFIHRLATVRILDPACGSGNFLYVAIQQLLGLEKEVITYAARPDIGLGLFPQVRPTQLHGIEVNPYAAELAQVVIWIGYLQWMRDNGFTAPSNPVLEPLQTIENRDAILDVARSPSTGGSVAQSPSTGTDGDEATQPGAAVPQQPGAAVPQEDVARSPSTGGSVAQSPSTGTDGDEATPHQPGAAVPHQPGAAVPHEIPDAKGGPASYRRNLPHIQPGQRPVFVTFCTHKGWELPESVRDLVITHCLHDDNSKLQMHALVVMPDHVHLLFTPGHDSYGNPYGLAEIMSGIKGASAHSINKALKRKGRVWQDESFDHILRRNENLFEKGEYICQNPVRKGLVQDENDYPWLWRESHVAQSPSTGTDGDEATQPGAAVPQQPGAAVPHQPGAAVPHRPTIPPWPDADFIIGNPPFLGSKLFRQQGLDDEYIQAMFDTYEIPNTSDLCCYWFERARQELEKNPLLRAGLLATQGIRGGANRKVLERIEDTGDIFLAWSDRNWVLDGAHVHVSIVGFDNGTENERMLDGKPVSDINASLTGDIDTGKASALAENTGIAFMGDTKGGKFDITWDEARAMLPQPNPTGSFNSEVVRPWVNGLDITRRARSMWIIDFGCDMPKDEAAGYDVPFGYVETHVWPTRKDNRRAAYAKRWWLHVEPRPELRQRIAPLSRFLITPRLTKYRLIAWHDQRTLPDCQVIAFARSDDYFFGVLHSAVHELWALRMGTQLEDRPRYTPTTCFETFPLPWPPGAEPNVAQSPSTGTDGDEATQPGAAVPHQPGAAVPQEDVAQSPSTGESVARSPSTGTDGDEDTQPGAAVPHQPGAAVLHEAATSQTAAAIHQRISDAACELNEQRERWLNPPEWIDPIAEQVDAEDDFADVPADARPLIRHSAIMARAAKDARLKKRTLTNLYNERPTWLRIAHEKLDRAVLAAYAHVDPDGDWSEDWAEVWTETGAGQRLPDDHPLAARRAEIDQRVLANLLRINLARAAARS